MTKVQRSEADHIRHKITTDDRWLHRAIVAIFEKQTEDEQRSEQVSHNNNVGFNSTDAQLLSSFAKQIIRWKAGQSTYANPLSPKQMEIARRKMMKYAGQLQRIAEAKRSA